MKRSISLTLAFLLCLGCAWGCSRPASEAGSSSSAASSSSSSSSSSPSSEEASVSSVEVAPPAASPASSSAASSATASVPTLQVSPAASPASSTPVEVTSTGNSVHQEDILEAYALNEAAYTYHVVTGQEELESFLAIINTLAAQGVAPEQASASSRSLLIKLKNGEKLDYEVSGTQVVCAGQVLESTGPQRRELRGFIEAATKNYPARPQWIAYMNPDRMINLSYADYQAGHDVILDTTGATAIQTASSLLKELVVSPGATTLTHKNAAELFRQDSQKTSWDITFDSATVYSIMAPSAPFPRLYVWPSDRDWCVSYAIADDQLAALREEMETLAVNTDGGLVRDTQTTVTRGSGDAGEPRVASSIID